MAQAVANPRSLRDGPWPRRALWAAMGLVLLWAAMWLFVPSLAKSRFESWASNELGRKVTVEELSFKPWSLEFDLDNIAIASADGSSPQLTVRHLYANAELQSLLRWSPVVDELTLDTPALKLAHVGGGRYDVDDILTHWTKNHSGSDGKYAFYNIVLTEGSVDYSDQTVGKKHEVRHLNLSLPFLSNSESMRSIDVEPHLAFMLNGSKFDSGAQGVALAQTHKNDANLRLVGFDIAPYATYLPASVPVRLQSGLIDADIKIVFEQSPHLSIKLSGSLQLSKVKVQDAQNGDLLALDNAKMQLVDVRPMEKTAHFGTMELAHPQLTLSRNSQGVMNWALPEVAVVDPSASTTQTTTSGAGATANLKPQTTPGAAVSTNAVTTKPTMAAQPLLSSSKAVANKTASKGKGGTADVPAVPISNNSLANYFSDAKVQIDQLTVQSGAAAWHDEGTPQKVVNAGMQQLMLNAKSFAWPLPPKTNPIPFSGTARFTPSAEDGGDVQFSGIVSERTATLKVNMQRLPLAVLDTYFADGLTLPLNGMVGAETALYWTATTPGYPGQLLFDARRVVLEDVTLGGTPFPLRAAALPATAASAAIPNAIPSLAASGLSPALRASGALGGHVAKQPASGAAKPATPVVPAPPTAAPNGSAITIPPKGKPDVAMLLAPVVSTTPGTSTAPVHAPIAAGSTINNNAAVASPATVAASQGVAVPKLPMPTVPAASAATATPPLLAKPTPSPTLESKPVTSVTPGALANTATGSVKPVEKPFPSDISIARLSISEMQYDGVARTLALDKVALSQPEVLVQRGADRRWMIDRWFKNGWASVKPSADSRWVVAISEMVVDGGRLRFEDLAQSRPVGVELNNLRFGMNDYSTAGDSIPAQVGMSARVISSNGVGAVGQISYSGEFGWEPIHTLGNINSAQLPLHALGPYFTDTLNAAIVKASANYKGKFLYVDTPKGAKVQLNGEGSIADLHAVNPAAAPVAAAPVVSARGKAPLKPAVSADEILYWRMMNLRGLQMDWQPVAPLHLEVAGSTVNDFSTQLIMGSNGRLNYRGLSRTNAAVLWGPTQFTGGKITFIDNTVQPSFQVRVTDVSGKVGMQSSASGSLAEIEAKGRAEGGSVHIEGKANLVAQPMPMDITAQVRDMDILALAPYASLVTGYDVERGRLNADVKYHVSPNGDFSATHHFSANRLAFGNKTSASDEGAHGRVDASSLADGNGAVSITVPVSGSVRNATLGVQAALRHAIQAQLRRGNDMPMIARPPARSQNMNAPAKQNEPEPDMPASPRIRSRSRTTLPSTNTAPSPVPGHLPTRRATQAAPAPDTPTKPFPPLTPTAPVAPTPTPAATPATPPPAVPTPPPVAPAPAAPPAVPAAAEKN